MGFVDDDDIPAAGAGGRQHLGPFDVVDRSDRDGYRLPRIDANGKSGDRATQPARVEDDRFDAESRGQFVSPLIPQARGRDDENTISRTERSQLCHDQPRLDRLAESDIVGKQ